MAMGYALARKNDWYVLARSPAIADDEAISKSEIATPFGLAKTILITFF
jgi:hypothetical protein